MWRPRLILAFLLCLAAGSTRAASPAEQRSFDIPAGAFNIGNWQYAETNFADFAQKYTNSDLFPAAILYQAQARYYMRQYDEAVSLLSTNRSRAGWWADQFAYWTGESEFASGKIALAADTFARLCADFPVSTNRFRAVVREAEARAQLQQWNRVIELLDRKDGIFQQALRSASPTDGDLATTGYLILGEAQLALKDYAGTRRSLDWLAPRTLKTRKAWRRDYLKYRLQLDAGGDQNALAIAEDLVTLAKEIQDQAMLSESFSLEADQLELAGKLDQSISALTNNLVSTAPAERQRVALLKIADLSLKQNRIAEAARTLAEFLNQQTNSPAYDTALLTLGELQLKQFAQGPEATNHLGEARECFDRLLAKFPASALTGKAWLDKGWCEWLRGNYLESGSAFQTAAGRLTRLEDQAVARFKWADTQFKLEDFAGALTNYTFLAEHFASVPAVTNQLLESALYQSVRTALAAHEPHAAAAAMERILSWYPEGFAGGHCLLLTGQGFSLANETGKARELFQRFETLYPNDPLAAEVRLAVARSYEREGDWPSAITNYNAWLLSFTNHPGRPAVEFSRAWDNYQSGLETNAFDEFTNFVAQFPSHPLAQEAQWWIADYFFRQGKFPDAEGNYRLVFLSTNWPPSELTYQAQMMAGRAAVARLSYKDATNYFATLTLDSNCPIQLRLQAQLACGDSLMSRTDTDATNHQADLNEAKGWFNSVVERYPTNELAPAAWGLLGKCYLQLAAYSTNRFYEVASHAYQQVLNLPQATVAARSQAKMGLGLVAEKLAQSAQGDAQADFYRQALTACLDVVLGKDLKPGESPDVYWVLQAGLEAFAISSENLNDWPQALGICKHLTEAFPQLSPALASRALKAREHLASGKDAGGI